VLCGTAFISSSGRHPAFFCDYFLFGKKNKDFILGFLFVPWHFFRLIQFVKDVNHFWGVTQAIPWQGQQSDVECTVGYLRQYIWQSCDWLVQPSCHLYWQ